MRAIKSEWIKLRSLRSTFWSFLTAGAFVIGLGLLFASVEAHNLNGANTIGPGFDVTQVTLRGAFLAQLAIGVLGVMAVTGEYSTGMIRATMSAVPRRLPVLWAKLAVFAATVFVLMGISVLIAFEIGQAVLANTHHSATLSSPGALRAVIGTALYLSVLALLAIGLGFLIRNTAGAIAALFGLLLVLPILAASAARYLGERRHQVPADARWDGHHRHGARPDVAVTVGWLWGVLLVRGRRDRRRRRDAQASRCLSSAVRDVTIDVGPTVEIMARPMVATSTAAFRHILPKVSGVVVDVSLAFGVFIIGLPSVFRAPTGNRHFAVPMLFDIAFALPLVWRRRWPTYVFALIAAVAFAQWLTGERYAADVALLVAFYTVAAREDLRRTAEAAVVLEVGIVLAIARWSPGHLAVLFFVLLSGMASAAFFIGTTMRTRRAYLASVEDRATRLELERDQQSQIIAAAERARIARDMHDIVAHNLSVMIALADGAALTMPDDPLRASTAMKQVSVTGRQALTEMRRLLGVLREGKPAALEPQPSLLDLDQLLAQVRLVGLRGELVTEGSVPPLPAGLQLTVYRLVQEALTNTLKHAVDAHTSTVRLRFAGDRLEVEVIDDGEPVASSSGLAAPPAGHGITGMQERAAVYGGKVDAGPRTTNGWRVRCWFDLRLNDVTP